MKHWVISIGDETIGGDFTNSVPTAICDFSSRGTENDYYTLDGRKLNFRPSKRGIYVKGGQKIVVK